MTRYLKGLGVATMAALAFSALATTGASAQTGAITSDGPVTLDGTEVAEGVNSTTMFGQEMQCPESHYFGHKVAETPHQFIPSGAEIVTITTEYTDCENGSGSARNVDMNGCDYEFYHFTTTPEEATGTYGFTARVLCPVGSEIEITGGLCTVRVPEQEGLTGLHATNEAGGKIRIHGTIHNVTAHTCFGMETNQAQWHTDVTFEGTNALGETTQVNISH